MYCFECGSEVRFLSWLNLCQECQDAYDEAGRRYEQAMMDDPYSILTPEDFAY